MAAVALKRGESMIPKHTPAMVHFSTKNSLLKDLKNRDLR